MFPCFKARGDGVHERLQVLEVEVVVASRRASFQTRSMGARWGLVQCPLHKVDYMSQGCQHGRMRVVERRT